MAFIGLQRYQDRSITRKLSVPRLGLAISGRTTIEINPVIYKMTGFDLGAMGWVFWDTTDPSATPITTVPPLVGALAFKAIM